MQSLLPSNNPNSGFLQHAKNTDISVTSEQVKAVGVNTRHQTESLLWFHMWTGRITASKFKSAGCTDPATTPIPSIFSSAQLQQSGDASTRNWLWIKSIISLWLNIACMHVCIYM